MENNWNNDVPPDEFYFESDQVALKGNKDYQALLKTVVILEAQYLKAVQDAETINRLHKEAISDPERLLTKLKNNEDLGVPTRQKVTEIPKIDWSRYSDCLPEGIKKSILDNCGVPFIKSENNESDAPSEDPKIYRVNCNESSKFGKPETYNRLWTTEEQTRLEELLVKFPPEPIESRRFAKIAKALGNRTTQQVSSRVQKYFLKLRKAGLPIPGRIPKKIERKGHNHKHRRNNRFLYRPSTFFPENEIPVWMSEYDDDLPGPSTSTYNNYHTVNNQTVKQIDYEYSDDETSENGKFADSEAFRKIELLKRVKKDKERNPRSDLSRHIGFKCDLCEEEPIMGTRWHCEHCDNEASVDYCSDCVIAQYDSDQPHPMSHRFVALRVVNSVQSNIMNSQNELTKRNSLISNSAISNNSISHNKVNLDSPNYEFMSFKDELMESGSFQEENNSLSDSNNLVYDQDYCPESFSRSNSEYNYLDPNFMPQ